MNYRFSPDGAADLRSVVGFYNDQRPGLGDEFAVEVGAAIARVLEGPGRWPEVEPGVRKYRLDRFPHAIYYRTNGGRQIMVVAVFDLRSESGSWGR